MASSIARAAGSRLARFLAKPRPSQGDLPNVPPDLLVSRIRPGDVLLVEGTSQFSTAIKYLTQSTWSHAALCIGHDASRGVGRSTETIMLVEADVNAGVQVIPLSAYALSHTRICRPVGLSDGEIRQVIDYALARVGHHYDLRNIIDLARYLLPTPPVPTRFRRRMIALGSGDPTRAICSSLVALAFQSVRYPILPEVTLLPSDDPRCKSCYDEVLHIRHHSLFTPRDFDVSPYFDVIKPIVAAGFDPHSLVWHDADAVGRNGAVVNS